MKLPSPPARLMLLLPLCLILAGALWHGLWAGNFLGPRYRELVWLNFSGRATESFERIGGLLSENPQDYRAYFIRAECYAWFIASNWESHRYDNQLLESLEACLRYAERVRRDSPEYLQARFFRALALVEQSRFKAMRDLGMFTPWSGRAARSAAEELARLAPDQLDARLPLAIFHYYWGGRPLLTRMGQFMLLLPRGEQAQGLALLERISRDGDDCRLWADLVLLHIYARGPGGNREQTLRLVERLHNMFPDNATFQLTLGDCYRQGERWVLAEGVYRSVTAKVASRVPSYDEVIYETGRLRTVECQVQLGKMDEAFNGVRGILTSNPINPEWVVPWAHYYAARIYRQWGQPRRAERALRYATDGTDHENLHKLVEKELEEVRRMLNQD